MPAIMELGLRIQEDYHKFKVSLDYKVKLRPAWTIIGVVGTSVLWNPKCHEH